ncbi:MAG: hypothetical protein LAO78_15600 [Acidobacteriia bacterium]|nr:hypothetical protein [Terriglobia bacterium]
MTISFLAAKRKYKGVAPTYAWLARKALLTRNHWKQITETDFVFEKSGEEVTISDDMNLLKVIHIVIDTEFGHDLASWDIPLWQRHMYLHLAHEEADKAVTSDKANS